MNTIYSRFLSICSHRPKHTALAYLHMGIYRKISYSKLNDLVLKLVDYFISLEYKEGDRVIIFSENRWEWPVVDLACNYLGLVVVPIHTTYGVKYIDYIISETSPKCVFVSDQKLFDQFSKVKKELINNINIVVFDIGVSGDHNIEYFRDILEKYKGKLEISPISDDNKISTIIYTSGTTGMPKGVCLTNKNITTNIDNVLKYVPILHTDRFFSFLPLSHVLERVAGQMTPLLVGASIYYSRNPKTIIDDIKRAKPTIFVSVPRIFDRIFDKIHDNLRNSSKLKQKIFYKALRMTSKAKSCRRKHESINILCKFRAKIFDKLVFSKIRHIFGGNLRLAISGGSSLDKKIAKFFEDVGIKVLEGYGLTETSPIISVNKANEYKFGTVGFVLSNLELKINEEKEIVVRGESVMNKYWNDDLSTSAVIDNDGWFHTGDLGFVDKEGYLNIIGRKKEIIVLSTGKNIVPSNIENALNFDKYINQSIVIGNNRKFLTALIVPDFEELSIYCEKNNIKHDESIESFRDEFIYKFFKDRINFILKDFSDYEQIINFYLLDREFDQEHDELTPTLKLKREKIVEHFNNIINKFYK
ncbi:MAG: long-chain fatty acid--CoA ligase [Patescibacteria group bacterium]|nr:long-chain fatty acid--CoA ligase [Patescibacteria group bacterium]MDD4304591.1 long-chain fatty acid--CoA ligase [Patescibacteria group bacterium]MDD4695626.1 long-chain fatty acid--CoA ligase [Patescibacteria group bacterium]